MATPLAWKWVVGGLLATLTMDLVGTAFRKLGLTAGIHPELVGRWFASLARGQLLHRTIAEAAPVRGELPMALAGHYLIGLSLTAAFWLLLFKGPWQPSGTAQLAAAAVAFGLFTNVLPWLFMFPSMGFGFFGLEGPPEAHLLRSSFLNHVGFGAGLALWTRVLGGVHA